jgi:3-hydroxyisobutyrate dehydrogenase/2-hydroxy-3-oxopropionate reductase
MTDMVAFLGTGLMGAPMVRRLLGGGCAVRVWNRSPGKALALCADGAAVAGSAAAAVAGVAVVCLCLTDGDAVEQVLFGADGIAGALAADATLVDFSTIGPGATRALAARLAAVRPGVRWIDAPVSGGVAGAETGELVVLCGGEAAAVDALRPLLAHLARRVCHLGPAGSGQAAKLCNQSIVASTVVAIAEALALGREQGLDIAALPAALAGGWADSLPLQIIGSRMAAGVSEPAIVSLGTYVKDLALVLGGVPGDAGLAGRAAEVFGGAASRAGAGADVTVLLDHVAAMRRGA